MPWKFSMFFIEYLRISSTENTPGDAPVSHKDGGRAPLSCGPHVGPLHLFQHPSTSSSSRKKSSHSSNSCSFSFCCHFRSRCSKHHSQNCFGGLFFGMWLLQLVFVLVLYLLQIFLVVVTLFLSLHVKFIWSKVVTWMELCARRSKMATRWARTRVWAMGWFFSGGRRSVWVLE